MVDINILLDGFKRFHFKHFQKDHRLYEDLATYGQMPKTLVIACSDSRVDPSILLDANPGDIFVIRNVANLVPPYQPFGDSYHGTSAALEFAVNNLEVEHIVVLGHSGCAGIQALLNTHDHKDESFSFVSCWMNIAKEAKNRTINKCKHSDENASSLCEKESIITSIQNLLTFPWVRDKVLNNKITLHGWYFSIENGKLSLLSKNKKNFKDFL